MAGRVVAMAVRKGEDEPMVDITEDRAIVGRGLSGDVRANGKRGVTLLSRELWGETLAELNADLPWQTRRANVLVEGIDLANTVGQTLRVGDVELRIWGETRPCALMDEFHQGLKDALKPNLRAGVHGEVVSEGAISVGDPVSTLDAP